MIVGCERAHFPNRFQTRVEAAARDARDLQSARAFPSRSQIAFGICGGPDYVARRFTMVFKTALRAYLRGISR